MQKEEGRRTASASVAAVFLFACFSWFARGPPSLTNHETSKQNTSAAAAVKRQQGRHKKTTTKEDSDQTTATFG